MDEVEVRRYGFCKGYFYFMARIPICGVYMLTNPIGQIYIGRSKDVMKRMSAYKGHHCLTQKRLLNSLMEYGFENHKFSIVEECLECELDEKERNWQEYYNCISDNGLNIELSGMSGKGRVLRPDALEQLRKSKMGHTYNRGKIKTPEAIAKTVAWHTGSKRSYESKLKMREKAKKRGVKVDQFDLEGNYITTYNSIMDASRETNLQDSHISGCCRGVSKTHGGFKWAYSRCDSSPQSS